ncbi:MAG: hypothetical protein ABI906_01965 [Pseudomonadota bacterium]
MADKFWRGVLDVLLASEGLDPVDSLKPSSKQDDAWPMDGVFRYGTLPLACLHEAGHVVAALNAGLRVFDTCCRRIGGELAGRTSVLKSKQERRLVALGGFAAELLLWQNGRLTWFDGVRPTQAEMIQGVARSCEDDRVAYFGRDLRNPDRRWPTELTQSFHAGALQLACTLDDSRLEAVGGVLLARGSLREEAVVRLARPSAEADAGR